MLWFVVGAFFQYICITIQLHKFENGPNIMSGKFLSALGNLLPPFPRDVHPISLGR